MHFVSSLLLSASSGSFISSPCCHDQLLGSITAASGDSKLTTQQFRETYFDTRIACFDTVVAFFHSAQSVLCADVNFDLELLSLLPHGVDCLLDVTPFVLAPLKRFCDKLELTHRLLSREKESNLPLQLQETFSIIRSSTTKTDKNSSSARW